MDAVFAKNRIGDDVIVTSFKFSPDNYTYFKFYYLHGTNTQQLNVNLMIKMKVTLTDGEGHMRMSKVTKMN